VEQVHEKGLKDINTVMTKQHSGALFFVGNTL